MKKAHEAMAYVEEKFFYDDGLLLMAYVWAMFFFLGSIIHGDTNWYLGMVFFAQNLSAHLCYFKQKDQP